MNKNYVIPSPIISESEERQLEKLKEQSKKLTTPKKGVKALQKAANLIPEQVRSAAGDAKDFLLEQEIYKKVMLIAAKGFAGLEKQAASVTLSEKNVLKKVNKASKNSSFEYTSLEELALARVDELRKISARFQKGNMFAGFTEGAGTGVIGLPGLPANIVAFTFLAFRSVQSIAMIYGYDTKNNPDELIIASEVLGAAMNPSKADDNQIADFMMKFAMLAEVNIIKQGAKKTWTEMAQRGGLQLLIVQIRALANKAAQNAVKNAGKKELEVTLMRPILESIGKRLTKDAVKRGAPVVGGIIGGLFDTAQIDQIAKYADTFYAIRFLEEKEVRINDLVSNNYESPSEIMDVIDTVESEEDQGSFEAIPVES